MAEGAFVLARGGKEYVAKLTFTIVLWGAAMVLYSSNIAAVKYEMLGECFDNLDSSIRLLRMKGSMSTFSNISPKIESLTDRRFTHKHLA
ncbi:hypothetical protein NC652_030413 [Populus alba x Populus x berolinensis]|uniref:CDT1 Geminin-binding domain-containing protein n=1 Tax=Populus alba x Populus x berolinensis TaxID=444605 RepID=A0AAD6LWL1_9ROSI|nr:hypothetical protein NC652_030413 [Populus alba x Populus x berolinensis]KAJ6974644.1 hypothetical protein NC653_030692 [Populus alba x Populus x berolinensis]